MTLKSIFTLLVVILVLASCSSNPLDVDASKTQVNIGFINLDSNLVNTRSANRIVMHHNFMDEISEIYEYNLGYCIRMSNASDSSFEKSLSMFLQDPYIKRLEKRIAEKFSDLNTYKTEIVDGFKHLKYHIPNGKIPENVVFMNSLFNSNAFSTEKQIGIGLDNYLGASTDVVKELPNEPYYEWIKDAMDPKFMTRDALCSWVMTHYVEEVDGNLAEHIIRWGKILYLTQAAFPNKEPELILRYSTVDYKWALDNEYSLWKYLVDEKMLFTVNELNTRNLLKEGPFTIGLPEKGPDRLGQFLGYRMILKYMEAKEITVEQLINTPYTDILVEYEID
jgi:hypothetical protein